MDIDIDEEDGVRFMRFGTVWCQGAMRLDAPDRLELAYAVRMFAWLLFHEPESLAAKHLVTLGLGAGSLTRFAHRVLGMPSTAVEIEAGVIEACRTHFDLPPDGAGLRVVHADARDFMAQPRGAPDIDILQVDAYDASVAQPALDSDRFYASCRPALRPGGTVAVNLIGGAVDVSASVGRIRRHLQPQAVWQFPPTEGGNVIVLAHTGEVPAEEVLAARAAIIEERWQLPAREWLAVARRGRGG